MFVSREGIIAFLMAVIPPGRASRLDERRDVAGRDLGSLEQRALVHARYPALLFERAASHEHPLDVLRLAVEHDLVDRAEQGSEVERALFDHDKVGLLASGQRADLVLHVQRLGAAQGGRAKHLGHGGRLVGVERRGALEADRGAHVVERVGSVVGAAIEPEADAEPGLLDVRIAHDARGEPHVAERLVGHRSVEGLEGLNVAVAQVDAVGGVQVTAEGECAGSLQHSQRILVHLADVLEQVDVELDAERLGDRRHVFDVGREEGSGVSGDLERSERVVIDELLLGRDDVRAVALGAEHREHEPHLRVVESAQVAAHEAGIERVRPVDRRGHARIDQACGAETHTGIGIGLAERAGVEREHAAVEPAIEVGIGCASADERLPEMVVGIDEAGHDDHPPAVDHVHPRRCREVNLHSRNLVADDEDVGVLELSEDAPVSEVRIHREHERGVLNQIAASSDGRGLLARVESSTISRRHDADNQSQAYPDVRASHVRTLLL